MMQHKFLQAALDRCHDFDDSVDFTQLRGYTNRAIELTTDLEGQILTVIR